MPKTRPYSASRVSRCSPRYVQFSLCLSWTLPFALESRGSAHTAITCRAQSGAKLRVTVGHCPLALERARGGQGGDGFGHMPSIATNPPVTASLTSSPVCAILLGTGILRSFFAQNLSTSSRLAWRLNLSMEAKIQRMDRDEASSPSRQSTRFRQDSATNILMSTQAEVTSNIPRISQHDDVLRYKTVA